LPAFTRTRSSFAIRLSIHQEVGSDDGRRFAVRSFRPNRGDQPRAPAGECVEPFLARATLAAFGRAAVDENVRAVVLTSAVPRRFSAGLDLGMMLGKSATEVRRLLDKLYVELADVQYNLGKPSIAAVGGAARGGGMTLAISCDVLIAGQSATFGYPEISRSRSCNSFCASPAHCRPPSRLRALVQRAHLWRRRSRFPRPRQPDRAGREGAGRSAGNGPCVCDEVADNDAAGARCFLACQRSRLPARHW
jgi:hypothetical protein